jgi:hypothetical protein
MFDRPTARQAAEIMASDSGEKAVFAGGCNIPFGEPWPFDGSPGKIISYNPPPKTYIVGLGHKAQQGKDTLAVHLIEKLGPRPEGTFGPYFPIDIRRYAFADELKVEVFDWLQSNAFVEAYFSPFLLPEVFIGGFYWNRTYSREEKIAFVDKNKVVLRPLLQKWGTEFRRAQDPDYWVKKTLSLIQEEKPQVAVITDMHFLNETKICDVQVNVIRAGKDFPTTHPIIPIHRSESELDTFPSPYTIVGESVDDLKKKGFDLVEGLLQERGLLPQ